MAMQPDPDLIFDVGVCNGDDSAYYLHRGYRVVGIEANPLLLPGLRQRFEQEIGEGRYQLVGEGIAASSGEAEFWVCDDHREWSSFDRSIASRLGCRHHSVAVPACRFGSLVERFGMPFYCKIDIEGNDELCLDDMSRTDRPDYLSIEAIEGHAQIARLEELGYTRFKIISQRTLRQPGPTMSLLTSGLPRWARRLLLSAQARLFRHRHDGSWTFPGGSSGPFGERTCGTWLSAAEAKRLIRAVQAKPDLADWHDIHAKAD